MKGFLWGVLTGLAPTVVLFFVLPALEGPRKKFLAWLNRKSIREAKEKEKAKKKEAKKKEDRDLLEEIDRKLVSIGRLHTDSDQATMNNLQNDLNEIKKMAQKIETEKYIPLKEKLILYANKYDQLRGDMGLKAKQDLLDKDGCTSLRAEIKETLSHSDC